MAGASESHTLHRGFVLAGGGGPCTREGARNMTAMTRGGVWPDCIREWIGFLEEPGLWPSFQHLLALDQCRSLTLAGRYEAQAVNSWLC